MASAALTGNRITDSADMTNLVGERLVFKSTWDSSYLSTVSTSAVNSKKERDYKYQDGWLLEPNGDKTYALKTPLNMYLNLQPETSTLAI